MSHRTKILAVAAATATALAALTGTAAQAAPTEASTAGPSMNTPFVGAQGTYRHVTPARILDTRTGNGAPKGLVGAGREVSVLVVGRGGIPGGVSAVVLNVTAVTPSTNTFLTAYPSGTTRPSTSSLNVAARTNRANLVTVPVGSDGRVRIYNSTGTTHILADVVGAYHGVASPTTGMGSQYYTVDPQRFYDSRDDGGAYVAGEWVSVWANWGAGVNEKVTAYAANITVLQGTSAGYVAAGPTSNPSTSTVNYGRNQVIANMSVVPSSMVEGFPGFYVVNRGPGSVQIIIDVVGIYTTEGGDGLRFRSLAPRRIVDTRSGIGGNATPIGAGVARQYTAPPEVAGDATYTLVANTTIARPTTATYVTTYSNDIPKPGVSNLNAAAGETSANSTFVGLGAGNLFRIHNAAGQAPVIMDVMGSFELFAAPPASPSPQGAAPRQAGSATASHPSTGFQRSRG